MDRSEDAERESPALPFLSGVGGFNGPTMRWAIWPIEFWLKWQADLLKTAQPATVDWMARRREGTEAALRALERLCECADARDASKIQTEWIEDETKRLECDMRSLGVAFTWPQEFARLGSKTTQGEHSSR